ncbi:DUF3892 domain-containing protein [Anaeropeptidivorans aminofermentans]|jgi:hypothetical protein|uniref:DUF3892 domain-containing protein n=1 Tax=Anaeropeptidivorans aminofermentans TaxID=2934315 RepID=UPI002023E5E3|nr:DUF3892 domain-containing protein [Anaeropeptidivorans aminofermentans]MBE6011779.1 DUF3892 domain-containing protein [Lachnospiraceae bacterium]
MEHNQNSLASLPIIALQDIPTPNADAQQIVALVKEKGKVAGYKLSDGRILSKEEGVALARQGGIQGVGIATNQGTEYLKSLPDGNENNNLGNLPSISQK